MCVCVVWCGAVCCVVAWCGVCVRACECVCAHMCVRASVCAHMCVCVCKVQKPTLYAAKWQISMPNFSSDNKPLTLVQTKLSDIWTYKLHPSYSVCSNTPNSQTVIPISDSFVAIVCSVSSSSFWGRGVTISSELISV